MKIIRRQIVAAFFLGAIAASGQGVPAGQTHSSSTREPLTWSSRYQPITGKQRFTWFVVSTIGPQSLASGVFSAGFETARNKPVEYGPSWPGFGKRYGMRLSGVSTGNAIEASLGALWGEDPRYFRAAGEPFGRRIGNIIKMTFAARRRDGHLAPAYARYIAIPGNNFLSNTWRVESDSQAGDAARRTLWGFLGQMGGNAFQEFWPDIKHALFHKKR